MQPSFANENTPDNLKNIAKFDAETIVKQCCYRPELIESRIAWFDKMTQTGNQDPFAPENSVDIDYYKELISFLKDPGFINQVEKSSSEA